MRKPLSYLIACFICFLPIHGWTKESKQFAPAPLSFLENKGQIIDQNGKPRTDIQYKVTTPGMTLFIGNGQLHYQWSKVTGVKKQTPKNILTRQQPIDTTTSRTDMYRMDVTLVGANTQATVTAETPQNYYENHIQDHNATVAHSYGKITYKNVYPNIDWVLYIKNNKVEYDFVVHEGGHVKDIQLQHGGATNMESTATGGHTATTPMGSITEQQPYGYEQDSKRAVATSFNIKNNTVSFNAAPHKGTLIIDPTLEWATYYGGSDLDWTSSIACDSIGNVYLASFTYSANNIATTGSYQSSLAGYSEAGFIVKFNSAGTRLWATYFAPNNVNGLVISHATCDRVGNVYITGFTNGVAMGTTASSYQMFYAGDFDAFIAKFNTSGSFQWSTYFGGSGFDIGAGIACDRAGNVFLTGITSSISSIATSGSYQDTFAGGNYDAFLAKFNSSGVRQWATYFGGSGDESGNSGNTDNCSVACDTSDNVYLAGSTNSTDLPVTTGCFQSSYGGGIGGMNDMYVAKFNGSGTRLWSTYYGGSGDDELLGIACSKTNDLYITGNTTSSNNIASAGSYQSTYANDILVKFDSTGNRTWGTYYGPSTGTNYSIGVTCDRLNNVFIAGYTSSTSSIATANSYQSTYGGGADDGFFVQFSSSGDRIWATYFGGTGDEFVNSIACDNTGHAFITGSTNGHLNISGNSFQSVYGGGDEDDFVAKFNMYDTIVYLPAPFTDTLKCAGSTFNLPYYTTFSFHSNNTFTAQLSNASGSFDSAVNIGSVTVDTSGIISCTIPANTPSGTGYRFRIIASRPADTSLDDGKNIRIIGASIMFNSPLCLGDTIKLIATGIDTNATYNWKSPNNITTTDSSLIKPNFTFADSGKYYFTESVTSCGFHDTVSISVKPGPAKPMIGNNIACAGSLLTLSASDSVNGVTWQWTGPNAFTDSTQNPVIDSAILQDTGYYIVKASLNGCNGFDTAHVSVLPVPHNLSVTGNTSICNGDSLKLYGNTTDAGVVFTWTGPGNFSATAPNITIAGATSINSGNYYLSASLGNACSLKDTVHVLINHYPTFTLGDSLNVCEGSTLHLNAGTDTTGIFYSWSGPNDFSSTVPNTSITYIPLANTGMYTVTAINNGCMSVDSTYAEVIPLPTVSAIVSNAPFCVGNSISLSVTTVSGNSYLWTGPAGYSSISPNVSIQNATTANAGKYALTVTAKGCNVYDTAMVAVNPLPTIPVAGSNSPICLSSPLSLNASSTTTGVSYSWAGPNGFSATSQYPVINSMPAADSGTYTVTVTKNGCSTTGNTHVTIKPSPAGTASSNSPVCAADTIKINFNNLTPGTTYNWYGPDGFNSIQQFYYIPNTTTLNAGSYTLTASYNNCILYDTVNVTIKPLPAAPVAGNNGPLCSGSSLHLTALSSTPGVSYNWTGPNSFYSSQQNPVINNINAAAIEIYTATAMLNNCSSLPGETLVTINPIPTGTISSNSPVCAGDTIKLTATGSADAVYSWTGPNNFGSILPDPKLYNATVAEAGVYSLLLSLNGCATTLNVPVSVTPSISAPTIHISILADTICSGDNAVFTATATNAGSNPVYIWKVNGIPTGTTGNVYITTILNDADVITCSIESNSACQLVSTAVSNAVTIHVKESQPPPITINVYPAVYIPGVKVTLTAITPGNSNCLTYQWRLNGVDIPGANLSSYESYTLEAGDKVSLFVNSSCACTSPDTLVTNVISLGVRNITAVNTYRIFPNPAQDEITVEGPAYNAQMQLYNVDGKQIWLNPISFAGGSAKIHLSLPAGVYTAHIIDERGGYYTEQLVILK